MLNSVISSGCATAAIAPQGANDQEVSADTRIATVAGYALPDEEEGPPLTRCDKRLSIKKPSTPPEEKPLDIGMLRAESIATPGGTTFVITTGEESPRWSTR